MEVSVLSSNAYKQWLTKGMKIFYGFHDCKFGECLLGLVESEAVCHLSFVENKDKSLSLLKKEWPKAKLEESVDKTRPVVETIFNKSAVRKIMVLGTPFQEKVWKALLDIPEGSTWHYEQVAEKVGDVKAVRAVANAIAKNKVGFLIPCHRVIKKDGDLGKYGGGIKRKYDLLEFENATQNIKKKKI